MAQAEFKILAPTFRPTVVFDRKTGDKRIVSALYAPGTEKLPDGREVPLKYVCDEEEAPKHALSRALAPLNDVAEKAVQIAKQRKKELDAKAAAQETADSPTTKRIAELEAIVKRLEARR